MTGRDIEYDDMCNIALLLMLPLIVDEIKKNP